MIATRSLLARTALAIAVTVSWPVFAQNALLKVPAPDVTEELKSFSVADGFEVNLFAADPMIAKPIEMCWDERGRLWVVGSAVYPHIAPGESASDTITVLEDTNHDGVADKSTVFAQNLFIPTGVAVGDGGVYVANSTEILFLADTNGDLKADTTRVVLSGFGTEDTHHIVHAFRWGYDGLLYFNQSIYIHSHLETPHGPRHLNAGGVWAFRPDTMELEVFTRGLVNSWGHHFDQWGQSFQTDGAGGEGINYVFPGAAFTTASEMPRVLAGLNPGSPKHSGLERISGRHFPDDWQGNLITDDFRGHRVVRFEVSEDQSGFRSVEKPEVLTSTHVAFRPVDVKMGPDGALYVADWYNPIIQHGEVDFRDPRRDHEHGRIWRITRKGSPLLKAPAIAGAPIPDLIALLRQPEQWNRIFAKRELRTRDRTTVAKELENELQKLDPKDPGFELARLELLWAYGTIDVVNEPLLTTLLTSSDYHVRAAAVRVLSQWKSRLDNDDAYLAVLSKAVEDSHPRVRLEAVCALARSDRPEAAAIAMRAMPQDRDRFLEYALWTTMRATKDHWLPQVEHLAFYTEPEKLLYALKAVDGPEAAPYLLKAYTGGQLTPGQQNDALDAFASHADPKDLGAAAEYVLTAKSVDDDHRATQLRILVSATKRRDVVPEGKLDAIGDLMQHGTDAVKDAAMFAAGQWKLTAYADALKGIAENRSAPLDHRQTAMDALGAMGGEMPMATLSRLATSKEKVDVRLAAARALLPLAPDAAAADALELFSDFGDRDAAPVFRDFLKTDDYAKTLTAALSDKKLAPEIAKVGLRALASSGRKSDELAAALNRAGGLTGEAADVSPKQMARLVAAVQERGDAARGQKIYRRLDCAQCHAIAGSGGAVGPDLTSIGGSAQIDYLIDSIYTPAKAVKEGYHALLIDTKNGDSHSGVKVTESVSEIVLREATGAEVRIPLDTVAKQSDGGSLMPTGLADSLLESEFLDLVRFLSELGRTPEFSVGTNRFVRTWRVLSETDAAKEYLYENQPAAAVRPHESLTWVQAYSNVNGAIPLEALPKLRHSYWHDTYSFAKFTIEATTAGRAAIAVQPREGIRLWVAGKEVAVTDTNVLELDAGLTECVLILDRGKVKDDVQIQLVEREGANGSAQFKGGR